MHSADDLRLLSELLDLALDLPESGRDAWLASLQGEAARLGPTVQALLARVVKRETHDWLSGGPDFTVVGPGAGPVAMSFAAGQSVGPYRLVRELGRGGMGEVWLAEPADGQLKRTVALKLPMLGLRRALLVERFARERDILARLVHPHIARLYDAGVSADGQPFMALEYVQGTTLTTFCDRQGLGIVKRLALFKQVLEAVQYAHTRLVIHRDLKPGNILVGDDGQVRLLDFGIAKLLAEADGAVGDPPADALTQVGGQAYTPDYASPEQVRGEVLGTVSDVYSLGVVLYELLCGQRPYQLRFDSRAQLEQAIVETEALPPSARIDAAAAERFGTSPQRLVRELRGELDTIVLKALKKPIEARYATVAALAEDIRRHRRGEPVLAQPDSWAYRTNKLLRRHKAVVGGVTATVLALGLGLGAALWEAHTVQLERDHARRLVARGNAVTDFMSDLMLNAARGGKGVTVKDLLDRSIAYVDAGYANDPALHAELLSVVANFKSSLDGPVAGLPFLDRAQALLGPSADWSQELKLRCNRLPADFLTAKLKPEAASDFVEQALTRPDTPADVGAICLYQLAVVKQIQGDPAATAALARRALTLLKSGAITDPKFYGVLSGFAGVALAISGHAQEGEALFLAAEREFERLHVQRSYSGYLLRGNWATAAMQFGTPRRAFELASRNIEWGREDRPEAPPSAFFIFLRAASEVELGRYDAALISLAELLTLAPLVHDDRLILAAHVMTAGTQAQLGRMNEAEAAYRAAAAVNSPMLAPGNFGAIGLLQARAVLDEHAGNHAAALAATGQLLSVSNLSKAQKQQALITRAVAELGAGEGPSALTDAQVAVALGRELQGGLPDSSRTGRALLVLAKAQRLVGQGAAAHGTLVEAIRQLANTVDASQLSLIEARALLQAMDVDG